MKFEILGASLVAILANAPHVYGKSDVVSKVVAGYQGWFTCPGSSDPVQTWVHWGKNDSVPSFELWPDVREYTNLYDWGQSKLGNGKQAQLFSSYDDQTIDTHFKWMSEYGIDTAAVQRFGTHVDGGLNQEHLDGIFAKAANYSEKHGIKYYNEWDISGWTNFTTALPNDWETTVKKFTENKSYARHNGKPIVTVWGFAVSGRPGTGQDALNIVNYLKDQGAYVIVGSSMQWINATDYLEAFAAADMVQPWNVGAFNTIQDVKNNLHVQANDTKWLTQHNTSYQPVVFPGFSWHNLHAGPENQIPRLNGKFMWQQYANMRQLGLSNVMIAMFDEYDEGTAIAKAAENATMAPTDHYYLTLDADGESLSSDFYLRVAQDGGNMVKGKTRYTDQCPTKYRV
ncbi:hypothetical protein VKS41_007481 [Umbelopsis sp. WA50703]